MRRRLIELLSYAPKGYKRLLELVGPSLYAPFLSLRRIAHTALFFLPSLVCAEGIHAAHRTHSPLRKHSYAPSVSLRRILLAPSSSHRVVFLCAFCFLKEAPFLSRECFPSPLRKHSAHTKKGCASSMRSLYPFCA